MAISILDNHNRSVDQHPDCKREAAEGHNVAADVQEIHRNECSQQSHGQSQDRYERRAEVEQENNSDETDDHTFGVQVALQRSDGFTDQSRPVVACMDLNSGRQAGGDLSDPCLNSVDYVQGVLAGAHDDDASDGFSFALPFRYAFANVWSKGYGPEIAQENGCAVLSVDGNFLQVFERRQVSESSDHVARAIHFQH